MYLVGVIWVASTSIHEDTYTRQNMSLNLNILTWVVSSCNSSRHDGSNLTMKSNLIEFNSKFN